MSIIVRRLEESDLPVADHVMRVAFGTFRGLADPARFLGDADYVYSRWQANPEGAFAAEADRQLVGSNFATNWGSVAFFGPLTIRPDFWDRGVGSLLVTPALECFQRWGTTQAGLFTFADSQKHIGLYQKFGFWPRFLTTLMSKPVEQRECLLPTTEFSTVPEGQRQDIIEACKRLTDSVYEGIDVSAEIAAVRAQRLGDTIFLWDDGLIVGLAVCHWGAGTEAGSNVCYVKFGTVQPGEAAKSHFLGLLEACESAAAHRGFSRLVAGVNTSRHHAYRQMMAYGFRTQLQGVVMQRPNEPGYNRQDVYLIDDWR